MNDYCWTIDNSPYYLSHYGILGQKWGIRRFEDRYGHLTPAGIARYRNDTSVKNNSHTRSDKTAQYSDRSYKKLLNTTVNTIKTDKKKFATYVLGKNEVDTVLKANTKLSRIQTSKDFENFAYYAAYKKHDVNEYAGLFGKNLKDRARYTAKHSGDEQALKDALNMKIYKLNLRNTKDIKVASDENAAKATAKLVRDKQFKQDLSDSIRAAKTSMRRPGQQKLLSQAQNILYKDPSKLTNKEKVSLYKALNLTLTFHDKPNLGVQDKFYGELKKQGYGALIDVNDQQFSSYHAKRPMIIFDTSSTKVKNSNEISDEEINNLYRKYNTERIIKEIGHQSINFLPDMISNMNYNFEHERIEQQERSRPSSVSSR